MMNFSLLDILASMFLSHSRYGVTKPEQSEASKKTHLQRAAEQSEASKKTHLQRAAEKRARKGRILNARADRGDIGRIGDPPRKSTRTLSGKETAWATPTKAFHRRGPVPLSDNEVAAGLGESEMKHLITSEEVSIESKNVGMIAHVDSSKKVLLTGALAARAIRENDVDIQQAMESPPHPTFLIVPHGTSNKEAAQIYYDAMTSPDTDASTKIAAANQLVALRKTAKVSFDRLGLPEDAKSRVAVLLEA